MSGGFIESGLTAASLDLHRALASLQEELEAIDYYHQRVDAASDSALKSILVHNRDDEMEHAAMLLEWLRRTLPGFDLQLKKFLFMSGDLTALAKGDPPSATSGSGLGLANLK
ncbi:MAG: ferritin [Acidobacteria bacterium]|nr:ferritin [Acidobacteriota bacterium]MBI3487218.1 ferritin [Acidobacteriota bacterium]